MDVPVIESAPTAIAGFVGPIPQGPTGEPIRVTSLAEYAATFGPPNAGDRTGQSVASFFDNGGQQAYVVRVGQGATAVEQDYGDPSAATGLYSLDGIEAINLLLLPAIAGEDGLCGLYGRAAAYSRTRRAMFLADLPLALSSVADAARWVQEIGPDFASCDVAAYLPSLIAPSSAGTGTCPFPCSGAVAGIFARTDQAQGVWTAPAGARATVLGAAGVAWAATEAEETELSALGINLIRELPGIGTVIWGARTMSGQQGDDHWTYVPVRRLILFLEDSIDRGTQWAVFEPNGETLWATVQRSVDAFLQSLFQAGAFAAQKPEEAYFVRCDRTTMTQSDIDQGRLILEVGVAPLRPAEFVIFRIGQWLC